MTVVVLTDCPPKLRGDLTKWLLEINTGVYAGNLSARVREELWTRICENLKTGRATMVFRAANEQRMDFWVHNSSWEPVDYDGIKLMRRPSAEALEQKELPALEDGFSKAAKMRRARSIAAARQRKQGEIFTVVDIETTGLDPMKNEIIELAALRVEDCRPTAEYHAIVKGKSPLPQSVTALTGIGDEEMQAEGRPLEEVMREFLEFIGQSLLVCHNAGFDQRFLLAACRRCGLPLFRNPFFDTLAAARRKVSGVPDYKLATLASHYSLDVVQPHRALADCYLTYGIYLKLKES